MFPLSIEDIWAGTKEWKKLLCVECPYVLGTFNIWTSYKVGTVSVLILQQRKLKLWEAKELGQVYSVGMSGTEAWLLRLQSPWCTIAIICLPGQSDFTAANSQGQFSSLEAILIEGLLWTGST